MTQNPIVIKKCCKRVYNKSWVVPSDQNRQCQRTGNLEHEGKLYCSIHYPPNIQAKRDAASAASRREAEAENLRASLKIEKDRVCKGVTLEQLKALPDGAILKLVKHD